MSGLGIVLEESERSPDLRNVSPAPAIPAMATQEPQKSYSVDETLLPPLPATDDGDLIQTRPGLAVLSSTGSGNPVLTPSASSTGMSQHTTTPFSETSQSESIFIVPESYALDSSALSIDTPPIAFPSAETQSLTSQSTPNLGPAPASSASTSPLRRLKSIKNGIRKLSLSRIGSFSAPSTQAAQESPTNSDHVHNDTCSSSSGGSIKSTFSGSATASHAYGSGQHGTSTTASTPVGPSHMHTSSSGSNGSVSKVRRRGISMSNSSSSATPPLPSPIVTLSEDLSSTRKNIASVEQTFFENWCSNPADASSQVSAASQHGAPEDSEADKLAVLNTPDDLVEYSVYLSEHKKSVEMAYDVSRSRLINSGWCSGHDIENLNLQRDSSLSQIDSKLLQIEEKLNSEFNISFLNNKHMQQVSPRVKCATKVALSPSLKDLENKCLYFSAENGNLCQ